LNDLSGSPHVRQAAWLFCGVALLSVLLLHLLPALLAGLLVYELVHLTAPMLERRLSDRRAKMAVVAMLAFAAIAAVTIAAGALWHFFRSESGSLQALIAKMAEILEGSRHSLPDWLAGSLPLNAEALEDNLAHWLRRHGSELQLAGKHVAHGSAQVLIGLVIGALVALREEAAHGEAMRPLAAAMAERARRLAEAFRGIVFAQVRISAINTVLTGCYLALMLPLFGIHLPLTKTMIVLTFVVGLVPVIGNLISNTVIVVVSLAHSPQVALASLGFLVAIHKIEYFLNARIVGAQISARTWELLLAMLAMEAAFGLPGIVAAPIYYAYLKNELTDAGMI
jgi:predicted PurR-regulated permease PerM